MSMVLPWLDLVIVDRLSHDPLGADNLTKKQIRQKGVVKKNKDSNLKKNIAKSLTQNW